MEAEEEASSCSSGVVEVALSISQKNVCICKRQTHFFSGVCVCEEGKLPRPCPRVKIL